MHQTEINVTTEERVLVNIDYDLWVLGASGHAIQGVHMLLEVDRGLIRVDHVEILPTEDFDVGCASLSFEFGYSCNLYFLKDFDGRRLNHTLKDALKVMYVSDL